MIQIEKVEIKYFRSVYNSTLKRLNHVDVLSGKNDCGKSNIIRSLNLFFNNQTDWETGIDFDTDFNNVRKEEVRKRIKTRQFIGVKVHFQRGNRYQGSLPPQFWVLRRWFRGSTVPVETNSLREGKVPAESLARAQASLQRYLGTIKFEYVPAIKDRRFFTYSLGLLQDGILDSRRNDSFKDIVEQLNTTVRNDVDSLKQEFQRVADVDIDIHLPDNIADLFRAFSITTGPGGSVPFSMRGDGIQTRFLPSLLHHVSQESRKHYVWGFEEPENCLEHSLATQLAQDIIGDYANECQVLITSHSPAFICIESDNTSISRVYMDDEGRTSVEKIGNSVTTLHDEVGLLSLQRQFQRVVTERLDSAQRTNTRLEELLVEAQEEVSPILLLEGKTDKIILEEAWNRLFPRISATFRMISCDVSGDGDNEKAGCGILAKALGSCRLDQPNTVGLFDYDEEGIKTFSLDANFTVSTFSPDVKIHSNRNVAAIIYPDIVGKQDYRLAKNLQIEFMFPEDCIQKSVNGLGLDLEQKTRIVRVEGLEERTEVTTEQQYRKITNGKKDFAETVVPTFEDSEFEAFRAVFDLINQAFDDLR